MNCLLWLIAITVIWSIGTVLLLCGLGNCADQNEDDKDD